MAATRRPGTRKSIWPSTRLPNKHFQSKRAIWEELLQHFQNTANTMMNHLESVLNATSSSHNICSHDMIGNYFFEQYLMDDFCNKVIRLLLIEQFNDEAVQKIYDHWIFAKPLAFQSRVFSMLMEMKIIKHVNSSYLAEKYYAPIFLLARRWLFCGALTDARKQSFRTNVNGHIQKFFEEIREEN